MSIKYTKELLEPIVIESTSIREVLIKLGLKYSGGNHTHISKKIKEFNIDTTHFLGKGWCKGKQSHKRYTKNSFINEVLILDSNKKLRTSFIKEKLFEFNLKERICEECGQDEFWNNKKLILQLDHINGNSKDNRLINLKILCPNCHSQTPTFSGKKRK